MARYQGVLTVPVAAVVETEDEYLCWVETPSGTQKRPLRLGDSNDEFAVVESGLVEGDEVVLNPLDCIEEARELVSPALMIRSSKQKHSSLLKNRPTLCGVTLYEAITLTSLTDVLVTS